MIYPLQALVTLCIYLPLLLFGLKSLTFLCDDYLALAEHKRQENLLFQCGEIQVLAANLADAAAYLEQTSRNFDTKPTVLIEPLLADLVEKREQMHCPDNLKYEGKAISVYAHQPHNRRLRKNWPNWQLRWAINDDGA